VTVRKNKKPERKRLIEVMARVSKRNYTSVMVLGFHSEVMTTGLLNVVQRCGEKGVK
jgi:hypothetical protein